MEFYFDIKARESDEYTRWIWPPVWSGKIEAENKNDARKKIEEEFNQKFVLKESKTPMPFLLAIKPMNDYLAKRFEIRKCEVCNSEYTLNDAYITQSNGSFCSTECNENYKLNYELYKSQKYGTDYNAFQVYSTPPVIYKITNKNTNLCYIGKSTQSFTLRWWQHIKIGNNYVGDNKFYNAIKNSELSDWLYEIIEIIKFPDNIKNHVSKNRYILEREVHYMKLNNSIENGYNTLESIKIDSKKYNLDFDETI